VALLRKETYNLRHPMHLRHPVLVLSSKFFVLPHKKPLLLLFGETTGERGLRGCNERLESEDTIKSCDLMLQLGTVMRGCFAERGKKGLGGGG